MGSGKTVSDKDKKPKKKVVGLVAKAKRRKQVSESRLAQRTGKSTVDRQIEKIIKAIKEGKFKPFPMPKIDWKDKAPSMKDWSDEAFKKKLDKFEESKGREERLRLLAKGGKAKKMKAYSKGGKAK
jgi:hypothetical protein